MNRPETDFGPLEQFMVRDVAFHAMLKSVEAGIFDSLQKEPGTAEQVAGRFGFRPRPMQALLEMLQAYGLVTEQDGVFANTPVSSEYLVSESPFFQGTALELNNRFSQSVIQGFLPMLRGESGARRETDDGWAAEDTMRGTLQHAKMGALQDTTDFIAALPGFSGMRRMADIGGNHGEFCMALMDLNPDLRGAILDLPGVADMAGRHIAARGYEERLRAEALDLRHDELPEDTFDLVLASHILYAFMDDLVAMAGRVHRSLKSGGWFVAQHMNPDSGQSDKEKTSLEFITRMAGYPTHYIGLDVLGPALEEAGFTSIRTGQAGQGGRGLIVAAKKA